MGIIEQKEVDNMLVYLRRDAELFLREEYGLGLNIPINANGRLTKTLGRYQIQRGGMRPYRIELSKVALANGYVVALDVLKHELVHHALHVKGLPYDDRDEYFKQECIRLGVGLTEHYDGENLKMKRAVMECDKCGKRFRLERHLPKKSGYYHDKCGGTILRAGHEIS